MIINITHIGLALDSELAKENDLYGNRYFFRYRSLNQYNNQEGEIIRYEIHEMNTGFSGNELIYVR